MSDKNGMDKKNKNEGNVDTKDIKFRARRKCKNE